LPRHFLEFEQDEHRSLRFGQLVQDRFGRLGTPPCVAFGREILVITGNRVELGSVGRDLTPDQRGTPVVAGNPLRDSEQLSRKR